MKKRSYIIIIIAILAVVISAYIYIRFLKASAPQPHSQSESPIDLRPMIISKLQRLVKESSEGLYNLSIEKLEPDILRSQINLINAALVPDTAALQRLDKELKAPDDVFKISFSSVHITGLGILDFLHKDKIDLDTVFIAAPIVEVFHKRRAYNEAKRQRDSGLTFYQTLTQHFRSISIDAIVVERGTFITKNLLQKNKTRKFNQVKINISNLLIDPSTQYDKKRFLFSKEVKISTKDYVSRTPDSLYFFKIDSISIHATKHTLTAKHVVLKPRSNRQKFQKKLSSRADMFTVKFPKVVCNKIDWWALANGDGIYSEEAHAYNGFVGDYFNRALPPAPKPQKDNFPQQILMRVSQKINIKKLHVHKLKLS